MYYRDEVRDLNQVPKANNVKVSEKELELGVGLMAAHIGGVPLRELQR
jgi:hypothetical protein